MKLSDNLFKKIENKTGVEKSTILDLASKLQDGNMKNEEALRDVIKQISSITGKNVSKEKAQILSFLLSNYNDGRRKNFFCVAVNLLELSELQEVIKQLQSDKELLSFPIKEQSLYVVEKLQNIADKRNVKLKLIKKK